MYDIVFISFDEPNSDARFAALQTKYPFIQRVHGIVGIDNAHRFAARLSQTEMFYVIDGDCDVLSTFNFNYEPCEWDRKYTHVWASKNLVNGACYGYGGVKLFNRRNVLEIPKDCMWLDFCSITGAGIKYINEIACTTVFDQSPLTTFRAVVREIVKLTREQQRLESVLSHTELLESTEYADTFARLSLWKTDLPDTEYVSAYKKGVECADGILTGQLPKFDINNFSQLSILWSESYAC